MARPWPGVGLAPPQAAPGGRICIDVLKIMQVTCKRPRAASTLRRARLTMTAWVGPKTWDLLPLAGPRPRPRVGTLDATQGRHVGACNALEAIDA